MANELDRADGIIRSLSEERADLLAQVKTLTIDNARLNELVALKVWTEKRMCEARTEIQATLRRAEEIEAAAHTVVKDATPERDAGEPTGFSLVFSYKIDALYHAFGDSKEKCLMCEGGQVWTECCDGSHGCLCRGMQVLFGQCRVCGGTGWRHKNADTQANIAAIRKCAEATGGYLGNPHGRLR